MSQRREYLIQITVNTKSINRVIIDSHYESKHADTINDEIILELVSMLDGGTYTPDAEKDGLQ